jgi:hypothetical protein
MNIGCSLACSVAWNTLGLMLREPILFRILKLNSGIIINNLSPLFLQVCEYVLSTA